MGESIKSKYKPSYPNKYVGNPNNIVCRSSWERRFCYWADLNPNIIQWASEEVAIPYVSPLDNRVHRYYPDFLIKVKETTGATKTYLIDISLKCECYQIHCDNVLKLKPQYPIRFASVNFVSMK